MKKIEIAFTNSELGKLLKAEFVLNGHVEVIDRTKAYTHDKANSLEEYLPQPMPVGAGIDPIITLEGFVLAIVYNGSYDLLKYLLVKGIQAARKVIKISNSEGIKILTGEYEYRWSPLKRPYHITFLIPYEVEGNLEVIDQLILDIKRIDKAFKKFLNKSGETLTGIEYKFQYVNGSWKLLTN